jgi:hypothetical protein
LEDAAEEAGEALEEGAEEIDKAINAVSVSESAGLTSLNVYRTGGVAAAATVRYSLVNGTATAGSDFKAKTATLSFAAGQTNKAISFQIINDLIVDPDETFTITLTSPTGEAAIGTNTTTVTILDNDFSTGGQILEQPDQEIFISAFEWNQGRPAVVEVEGPLGAAVRLQATTDFSTWEDVAEGVLSNSPLEWTELDRCGVGVAEDGDDLLGAVVRRPRRPHGADGQ